METDVSADIGAMSKELKDFSTDVKRSVEKLGATSRELSARLLTVEQSLVSRVGGGPAPGSAEFGPPAPLDPATGMPILSKEHKFAGNLPRVEGEQQQLDSDVMWRGILTNRWPSRDCPEKKALAESSPSGGGYTLPLPVAAMFIDLARAASVCIAAGAQTLPVESSILRIPVLAGDVACTWKQENADVNVSDVLLDKRDAVPHTLIGLLYMSLELAEDSPLIGQIVNESFARSMAVQLDAAALVGNATYGPQGLKYNSLVHQTSGAGVGSLDYDDLSRAIQLVRYRNFEPNAYIVDPGGVGALARLKATTNEYLTPPSDVAALQQFFTTSVGNDAYVGDFSQLWFFPRTGISIEVSREAGTAFTKGQIAVRAYLRADVTAVSPAAFEIVAGYSS